MAAYKSRLTSTGRAGRFPAAYEPVRRDLLRITESMAREIRSADSAVAPIMRHIVASRGGMIRPALLLLSGKCLGRIGAAHLKLGVAVEMMHTATLLHDDVIDEAHLRRGRASLNSLWGNDCAVLAGDYLLARMLSISSELNNTRMSSILADTAQTMCRGELRQDLLRGRWDISENTYRSIVKDKTAAFFSACCSLGAIASGASASNTRCLAAFGLHIGMAFQYTDDLLDIVGRQKTMRKSNGSDIANGKLTLAFIRMLAGMDARTRAKVIKKLESRGSSVRRFTDQLRTTGALRYVYDIAARHIDIAVKRLDPIRDCAARASLVEIARSVTSRIDTAALAE